MKITRKYSRDDIRKAREAAYLAAWPLPQQAEAIQDRANGNPAKWDRMQADFDSIRTRYPWLR